MFIKLKQGFREIEQKTCIMKSPLSSSISWNISLRSLEVKIILLSENRRTWIMDNLGKGDADVFVLCNRAWCKMSEVISAAHKFVGSELPIAEESNKAHALRNINLQLESDLDPALPEQWDGNRNLLDLLKKRGMINMEQ